MKAEKAKRVWYRDDALHQQGIDLSEVQTALASDQDEERVAAWKQLNSPNIRPHVSLEMVADYILDGIYTLSTRTHVYAFLNRKVTFPNQELSPEVIDGLCAVVSAEPQEARHLLPVIIYFQDRTITARAMVFAWLEGEEFQGHALQLLHGQDAKRLLPFREILQQISDDHRATELSQRTARAILMLFKPKKPDGLRF